jgi:Uma2 family endonuclease
MHSAISHWLSEYENATPGTEDYDAASVLLGPETEPQPDLCLLISPSHGGQTWEQDDFIVGPPELLVEISSSTVAIDLHEKKAEYEKLGVQEYLVVVVRQQRVIWFVSRQGMFVELTPGADGFLRSEVFPGLWLDVDAAVQRNKTKMLEVLHQGLASPEHAAWVAELDRRAAIQTNKPAQGN